MAELAHPLFFYRFLDYVRRLLVYPEIGDRRRPGQAYLQLRSTLLGRLIQLPRKGHTVTGDVRHAMSRRHCRSLRIPHSPVKSQGTQGVISFN